MHAGIALYRHRHRRDVLHALHARCTPARDEATLGLVTAVGCRRLGKGRPQPCALLLKRERKAAGRGCSPGRGLGVDGRVQRQLEEEAKRLPLCECVESDRVALELDLRLLDRGDGDGAVLLGRVADHERDDALVLRPLARRIDHRLFAVRPPPRPLVARRVDYASRARLHNVGIGADTPPAIIGHGARRELGGAPPPSAHHQADRGRVFGCCRALAAADGIEKRLLRVVGSVTSCGGLLKAERVNNGAFWHGSKSPLATAARMCSTCTSKLNRHFQKRDGSFCSVARVGRGCVGQGSDEEEREDDELHDFGAAQRQQRVLGTSVYIIAPSSASSALQRRLLCIGKLLAPHAFSRRDFWFAGNERG